MKIFSEQEHSNRLHTAHLLTGISDEWSHLLRMPLLHMYPLTTQLHAIHNSAVMPVPLPCILLPCTLPDTHTKPCNRMADRCKKQYLVPNFIYQGGAARRNADREFRVHARRLREIKMAYVFKLSSCKYFSLILVVFDESGSLSVCSTAT